MIRVIEEVCNGCGICVKVCPHGVLAMQKPAGIPARKAAMAVLVAEERCIECGACQLNCGDDAIVVTKGTGCLVAIVRDDILKLKRNQASCGCG